MGDGLPDLDAVVALAVTTGGAGVADDENGAAFAAARSVCGHLGGFALWKEL